jgi:hypothetical protein
MSKQENDKPEDSEDNFGLPEIDFKPIDRNAATEYSADSEPVTPEEELPAEAMQEEPVGALDQEPEQIPYLPEELEEERSNSPIAVALIIGLLIVVAATLTYFFIYKPKADKAKQELVAKAKLLELKQIATQDSLARVREEEQRLLDAKRLADAKPIEGTIETLTDRTQRYYVVVTSNIDDDLIMDYAKKLSTKGISSKIIPPFGKTQYYRLSISDDEAFDKAQANADAAKAEYGNSLWVMKY